LLNGRERDELNQLIEELKQNLPKYGGEIMTYAEELRKEGEQRGIQLGEQKAKIEIAKEFLKAGVDSKIIANSTHLPISKIDELKKSLK
jgi:predicted transposase/invertase (TIGR01784 family)